MCGYRDCTVTRSLLSVRLRIVDFRHLCPATAPAIKSTSAADADRRSQWLRCPCTSTRNLKLSSRFESCSKSRYGPFPTPEPSPVGMRRIRSVHLQDDVEQGKRARPCTRSAYLARYAAFVLAARAFTGLMATLLLELSASANKISVGRLDALGCHKHDFWCQRSIGFRFCRDRSATRGAKVS
jgi:hypothetical protein